MSEDLVVPTAVCTAHFRFIPCRKSKNGGKDCVIKADKNSIELVKRYQDSVLGSND